MLAQDLERLRKLVKSPYDVLRCSAVKTLGLVGDRQSVPDLIGALRDEDPDIRIDAASALGRIGDSRAAPTLLENLRMDPCPDAKEAAIEALIALDVREIVPTLRKLVLERDPDLAWDEEEYFEGGWDDWLDLQILAIRTLGLWQIGDAATELLAAAKDEEGQDLSGVVCPALAQMGLPGLEALKQLLDGGTSRYKRAAAAAIAGSVGLSDDGLLVSVLDHEEAEIRLAATTALVALHPAHPLLAKRTTDTESDIRKAVIARAALPDSFLIGALLEDEHSEIRLLAAERLSEGPALEKDDPLARLLAMRVEQDVPDVAAAALTALSIRCPRAALDPVKECLLAEDRPEALRWSAVRALRNFELRKTRTVLNRVIRSGERNLRLEALSGLAEMARNGNEDARAVLIDTIGGKLSDSSPVAEEEETRQVELEDNAEVVADMRKSGLDLSEDSASAPTSTLGSILGDEQDAREFVSEAKDDPAEELDKQELEMLAMTHRMPGRKKVDLEASDAVVDQETMVFAANLLGDLPLGGNSEAMESLVLGGNDGLKTAAAAALVRQVQQNGLQLSDILVEAVPALLTSRNGEFRKHILKLAGAAGLSQFENQIKACLRETDTQLRAEAVKTLALLGLAIPPKYLSDESSVVRNAALTALLDKDGDEGREALDGLFSGQLQDQEDVLTLLSDRMPERTLAHLFAILDDEEARTQWPHAIAMVEKLSPKAALAA